MSDQNQAPDPELTPEQEAFVQQELRRAGLAEPGADESYCLFVNGARVPVTKEEWDDVRAESISIFKAKLWASVPQQPVRLNPAVTKTVGTLLLGSVVAVAASLAFAVVRWAIGG